MNFTSCGARARRKSFQSRSRSRGVCMTFTVMDLDGNLFRVFYDFVGLARWPGNPSTMP